MSADTWIEKQWAETDPRPRDELLAELKSLRARLAEAEAALAKAREALETIRDMPITEPIQVYEIARAALM